MNIELQYLNHEFDVEWRTAPHLTNPLDDCETGAYSFERAAIPARFLGPVIVVAEAFLLVVPPLTFGGSF
jgi:hypothetical protein